MRDHYNGTSSEEEEDDSEPIVVRKRNVRMVTTKNPAEPPVVVAVAPPPAPQASQDDERTRILAEMQAAAEEEAAKHAVAEEEAAKRAAAVKAAQEAARQKQQEAIAKAKAQAAQLQAAAKLRQEDARRQAMAEAAQRQAAVRAQTDAAAEQRAVEVAAGAKQVDATAKAQLENRQREQAAMRAQQEAIRAQATQAAMLQAKKLAAQQGGQNAANSASIQQNQQQQRPQGNIVKPSNGPVQPQQQQKPQQQQPIAKVQVRQQPERPSAPTPVQQPQAQRFGQPAPTQTSVTSKTTTTTTSKTTTTTTQSQQQQQQQQNRILNPTAVKPQSIADIMKNSINAVPAQRPGAAQSQRPAQVAPVQRPGAPAAQQPQKPAQAAPVQRQVGNASIQKQTASSSTTKPAQTPVAAPQKQATAPVNRFGQTATPNSHNQAAPAKQATQPQKPAATSTPAAPKVTAQVGPATRGAAKPVTQTQQSTANKTDAKSAAGSPTVLKFGQKQAPNAATAPAPSPAASKFGQKPTVNAAPAQTAPSKTIQNARGQAAATPAQTTNQTNAASRFGQKQTAPQITQSQSSVKASPKQTPNTVTPQAGTQKVGQKHVGMAAVPKDTGKTTQQAPSSPTKNVRFNGPAAKQPEKATAGLGKPATPGAAPTWGPLAANPGFEGGITWVVDDGQQGKLRTSQQTAAPSPVIVPAPFRHASSEAPWDGGAGGLQSSYSNSSIANRARMSSVDPDGAPKRKVVIDDEIWLAQRRVPQEQVTPYQPERIQIPEFAETVEVKPTVIVPVPAETTRVKWEFPEPEELARETVPKVKAQDWVPQNEVEHVVTKTTYAPSKIGQVWPPPNWATKEEDGLGEAKRTKATEDEAWIQHGFPSEQAVGTSPWSQKVTGSGVRERQWPPSANELNQRELSASTKGLSIQWPPPEFEEQKQAEIEVIQTHLPVKANSRQWPPPQYGNEENTAAVA